MSKKELKKTKKVIGAEKTYRGLRLKCISIDKYLEEIERTTLYGGTRTYTIPRAISYIFSYEWNNKTRIIEVVRKNGNSQTLETNIRVEITKQLEKELKEIENINEEE